MKQIKIHSFRVRFFRCSDFGDEPRERIDCFFLHSLEDGDSLYPRIDLDGGGVNAPLQIDTQVCILVTLPFFIRLEKNSKLALKSDGEDIFFSCCFNRYVDRYKYILKLLTLACQLLLEKLDLFT